MQDNKYRNPQDQGGEQDNQRLGRDLYRRDQQQQHHQNTGQGRHWDPSNNFHTGPSHQSKSHFPEDQYGKNSNADLGGSMNKHYGTHQNSPYRNQNSLNYGDGRGQVQHQPSSGNPAWGSSQSNNHFSAYGDGRGNYSAQQDSYGYGQDHVRSENIDPRRRLDDSNENYYRGGYMDSRGVRTEPPLPERNPYNDWPGGRSRYKDDDYRYGSGNHDWYRENRYTDNAGHRVDRDKGDILSDMGEGLRDAWHDIRDGAQNLWNRTTRTMYTGDLHPDRDRDRNHTYEYRSYRDRGREEGPRWSDESDRGHDPNSGNYSSRH
ncbi:hypothetical protein GU926_14550 [Nibribacter ruber]|uniref:Uncharacterized protein n=1 Tax=Nibribacter ruber TaxID=2698458 RepID=A0A6P1P2I0_9BACT|nr:hypothetical protein [Nibribacter ruber]QHL88583.1 hypothetical protein GU926_14550 [Nibribacter ruber]